MADPVFFATQNHIQHLLKQINAARLSVPRGFRNSGIKKICHCYNGIGPAAWHDCSRKLATKIFEDLEPIALIHDWEYTFAPKTMWSFFVANVRFVYNGIKYSIFCYGASAKTVRLCRKSVFLAVLCQMFGWRGYKSAKEK